MADRASWLRLRPPARGHLLIAAGLWTVVGCVLSYVGVRWVLGASAAYWLWLLPVALVAGLMKGRIVLGRAAARTVARIRARGDGRFIAGVFSPGSWVLVLVMMVTGRVLRSGVLPREAVGLIYSGIGTALLVGSRQVWSAWYRGLT